ncbi:hypothetical protein NBRC10512_003755 [Rhodotorula toruloides]|uniref:RHTO0S03e12860g1_1 n=2 Tax=Rhodotorula toruloides TaxID=5286 RepID=A0A061AMB3_RHOTO|nr:WW domain-binding protein 4 [Rhodotorula toruloides NP11]EMS26175.1 WW domain-binding protein 4 [Rhodotorula toruloides NP11]CDR38749.1 RHTO0S03e12860g1_1 [Rhodotorula toruloides]
MADYWVSRDKYFCKYCKIYIADDKPSRIHHETGLRHKGNYERYIRDIYKKGMQEKKDRREEAEEVARVEAAAAAAMGLPPPAPAPTASSSKPKPAASGPPDPYTNYTTASSLGIKDEEAEREAEMRALRQKEGRIGEWERVVKPSSTYVEQGKGKAREREEGLVGRPVLGGQAGGSVKREDGEDVKPDPTAANGVAGSSTTSARNGDDEEEDEASNPIGAAKKRGFLTEKTLADDDDDPLASLAPIKLKKRRLTVKEQQAEEEARLEKEREKEEARKLARESGAKGGWQQVDLAQEGDEEFDPLADIVAQKEEEERRKREEEEAEERRRKEELEEDKPKVSTSGFKKRKMAGAAAARKR